MEKAVETNESAKAVNAQLQKALTTPGIANLYANGFLCARTNADVFVVLQTNGGPNAILNMSYTTAKTLAEDLATTIKEFEDTMQHSIMTIHDINQKS